jgi:hypothetical protein
MKRINVKSDKCEDFLALLKTPNRPDERMALTSARDNDLLSFLCL